MKIMKNIIYSSMLFHSYVCFSWT